MVANDCRPDGRIAWLAFLTLVVMLTSACGVSGTQSTQHSVEQSPRRSQRHPVPAIAR